MPSNQARPRHPAWRFAMLAAIFPLFVWLDIAWVGAGLFNALVTTALIFLWSWFGPRLLDPLLRRTRLRAGGYGYPSETPAITPGPIPPLSEVITAVAHREPPQS